MPAVATAVLLAALYLVLDPPSADLAAQTYRTGLFDAEGWSAWDNHWYSGHHMPGYSVLFPPLASLLGLDVVAALSLIGATAAATAIARQRLAWPAATAASLWFAAGMAAMIVSGRLAFALGAALGSAGLLGVVRQNLSGAALGGAATALASPVAALFVALAAAAIWWEQRDRSAAALVAATVVPTAVLVLAFPEGGTEPFVASAFWPALIAAGLVAGLTHGPIRTAALLYALLLAGTFLIDNPLGGNATRLGALATGPLAAGLLWADRRRLLAILAIPLAYWTLYPAVRDVSQSIDDPARAAAYYRPLLDRLRGEPPTRLEIPFTEGHWESARVAPEIPLARGWERQLDRKVNTVFYEGELTPERYRAWLDDNAVAWVALPDAPLDHSAEQEAALIRGGLPYLDEVWSSEHWRLFAVRNAVELNVVELGHDWFTTTGGTVRVRWTPYWAVVEGRGCVSRTSGDWTSVSPDPAGSEVRVGIRVTPRSALSRGRRCR